MTTLTERMRRAFPFHDWAPRSLTRYNRRQWIRAVRHLGDKWVALQNVERKERTV